MIHHPTRLDLFRSLPPGSVGAEIGVWRGYFSQEILRLPNIARLYLIDSWCRRGGAYSADPRNDEDHAANMAETMKNVAGFGERATLIQQDGLAWLKAQRPRSLDFVYLDANHDKTGVCDQLLEATGVLGVDGLILGHDYRTCPQSIRMGFGVVEAVTEFCVRQSWRLTALALDEWPSYKLERA